MDLHYKLGNCQCLYATKASIEVFGDLNKSTVGKLYSVCKNRACNYWSWLNPESVTYSNYHEQKSSPVPDNNNTYDLSNEVSVDVNAIYEEPSMLKHEVMKNRRAAKEISVDVAVIKGIMVDDRGELKEVRRSIVGMKKLVIILLLLLTYVVFFK